MASRKVRKRLGSNFGGGGGGGGGAATETEIERSSPRRTAPQTKKTQSKTEQRYRAAKSDLRGASMRGARTTAPIQRKIARMERNRR